MAHAAARTLPVALALQARLTLVGSVLAPAHVKRLSAPAPVHDGLTPFGRQSCSSLANKGTHFTVDIQVGTPGQTFSVVADTGSNTLLVPHCFCQETGYCDLEDRCYTGVRHSSTFSMVQGIQGPQSLVLSYGSGEVQGVVARDTVRVGQLDVFMKDGILLMVRKALTIAGSFEGILGLGIPRKASTAQAADGAGSIGEIVKRIQQSIARGSGESALGLPESELNFTGAEGAIADQAPGGILEQAKIWRFTMCFNDGADGVLQIGTPPLTRAHGSVGEAHWGLGLVGLSVGNKSAPPLSICSPTNMTSGQQTPCGAIPDSGTTAITAPREELQALLESLCDAWPRCRQNYTALVRAASAATKAAKDIYGISPFNVEPASKATIFEFLLEDCRAWLDEATGLSEMPDINFHVAGNDGTRQTLSFPASAYIFESTYQHKTHYMQPVGNGTKRGKQSNDTVCMPGFSVLDYTTQKNGPVWILGTPLFYLFNVGFDMSAEPPAVSFTSVREAPCGSCDEKVGLVTSGSTRASTTGAASQPRWVNGPPRLPDVDVRLPL